MRWKLPYSAVLFQGHRKKKNLNVAVPIRDAAVFAESFSLQVNNAYGESNMFNCLFTFLFVCIFL